MIEKSSTTPITVKIGYKIQLNAPKTTWKIAAITLIKIAKITINKIIENIIIDDHTTFHSQFEFS